MASCAVCASGVGELETPMDEGSGQSRQLTLHWRITASKQKTATFSSRLRIERRATEAK